MAAQCRGAVPPQYAGLNDEPIPSVHQESGDQAPTPSPVNLDG